VRLILTDTANDRKIRNYYCYDAFGESVISHEDIHNRFRFNGEQYDPVTSQYYLRARFYNPIIGRFTQEDTYYGDGLNLYEYCRNNPVLYRDPSGHDAVNQGNLYKNGKYSEAEIKSIIDNLKGDGFKNNPLRQAYENEVAGLKAYGERLLASGMSEEQVARTLNQARRDLGIKYKNATPQPLRDYIYEINMGRYKDKLGPTYDWLVSEKGAKNMEIINSSSRPNSNIDKLLSGFEEWLRPAKKSQ